MNDPDLSPTTPENEILTVPISRSSIWAAELVPALSPQSTNKLPQFCCLCYRQLSLRLSTIHASFAICQREREDTNTDVCFHLPPFVYFSYKTPTFALSFHHSHFFLHSLFSYKQRKYHKQSFA
ncbi:hypothetical protein ACOSQ3_007978 [Xanthoceras sorbifolium]